MKKLIITALLMGLIAVCVFAQEATEPTKVEWTIAPWVEITIMLPVYGFGEIDPGADEAEAIDANEITIACNSDWVVTYEVDGSVTDYLEVTLSDDSGTGDATVFISYRLVNLREMETGDYNLVVTFTVAVK